MQSGILSAGPAHARFLSFLSVSKSEAASALSALASTVDGERTVIGIGAPLAEGLGATVRGLRTFPAHSGPGIAIPSSQTSLWCWLRGDDRGELLHRGRGIEQSIAGAFRLEDSIDAFRYGSGLDLTGYEDGTENPQANAAHQAAIVTGVGPGLDGSSFVAVQTWVHDLDRFERMPRAQQDSTIGRRKSDNEEIEDAPASAHVKRAAQESFVPEAFMLRRSMPWSSAEKSGLVFVAFGRSLDAFEAVLGRMIGREDGIVDALFTFTRPVTGGYYWCPPMRGGRLDLRALDLA